MSIFFKSIVIILITVILGLVISKKERELGVLLTLCALCLVLTSAIVFIEPIIDFFQAVKSIGNIDNELFRIILKGVGIGILGEITSVLCQDSGNAALGKGITILSASVILWLSIPLLNELLTLIQTILGTL